MTVCKVDTKYGVMFIPDTDTAQYHWLHGTGRSAEDQFIVVICDMLKERERGIALDVGANFGTWTLPLSMCCAHVIAFEPQFKIARLLSDTITENKILNVMVYPWACGSLQGISTVADVNLDVENNFGGVSLGRGYERVRIETIDSVIDFGNVSFIKIDVEGDEISVLKGALRTIRRCKPILFVEALHPRTDTEALRDLIVSEGYGIETAGPNYMCLPI